MPPSYRIRTHPRARHVKLRVQPDGALVVTAPPGIGRARVDAIVAERADWISQARRRAAARADALPAALQGPRPERIELPAVSECWSLSYHQQRGAARSRIVSDPDAGHLGVHLADDEPDTAPVLLCNWLRARARPVLEAQVADLAEAFGFGYGRISIRNQRSRWGSCSSKGNLSLNARLLFASPAACRYVLVHELVHTRIPNHSPAFWSAVAELEPDYLEAERELDTLWPRLPGWVDPVRG